MPNSPFIDHAAPVLAGDPSLNDQQRADLWDAFHSKDAAALVDHLHEQDIPQATKQSLWEAKQRSEAPTDPIEKTTAAIKKLQQLDPEVLELAEAHPNVLKALIAAAHMPENGSEPASGASKSAGKGKQAAEPSKPAPAAAAPAPEPSWVKFRGKDGNIYEVHPEDLHHVQRVDPAAEVIG